MQTNSLLRFRAEVDIEVEARTLDDAERVIEEALADMIDRNAIKATLAIVAPAPATAEQALAEWAGEHDLGGEG